MEQVDPVLMVVRVSLPDRPGALGLVASRLGAVGADIAGIDVLEQSGGTAIDEFAISLPDPEHVDLLVREIEQVDGAVVDEWRVVERFPDPRLDALSSIARICIAPGCGDLYTRLAESVRDEFDADWAVITRDATIAAADGEEVPDARVINALAARVRETSGTETGADDLLAAQLVEHDALLLVGRDGHPFRARERHQLSALAEIADRIASLLPET